MIEPLSERERELILLALMKMGGEYVELMSLLQRLADKNAVLCLQTDARVKRRGKPVTSMRAVP
jgi:hypothetical protein